MERNPEKERQIKQGLVREIGQKVDQILTLHPQVQEDGTSLVVLLPQAIVQIPNTEVENGWSNRPIITEEGEPDVVATPILDNARIEIHKGHEYVPSSMNNIFATKIILFVTPTNEPQDEEGDRWMWEYQLLTWKESDQPIDQRTSNFLSTLLYTTVTAEVTYCKNCADPDFSSPNFSDVIGQEPEISDLEGFNRLLGYIVKHPETVQQYLSPLSVGPKRR